MVDLPRGVVDRIEARGDAVALERVERGAADADGRIGEDAHVGAATTRVCYVSDEVGPADLVDLDENSMARVHEERGDELEARSVLPQLHRGRSRCGRWCGRCGLVRSWARAANQGQGEEQHPEGGDSDHSALKLPSAESRANPAC